MLDCRVVAADDECQTILPPPPSYDHTSTSASPSPIAGGQSWWPQGTFWEQREIITSVDGWGSCVPCPCELRKLKKQGLLDSKSSIKNNDFNNNKVPSSAVNKKASPSLQSNGRNNRAYHTNTTLLRRSNNAPGSTEDTTLADNCLPSSQIPEWGPPPCYSEN